MDQNLPPVCLIIPPSVFLLDERVFTSLGILRVAAVLEQRGYRVDVLDLSGVKNYVDAVEDYLWNVDISTVIGLTATTPQMPATYKILETIRAGLRKFRVILGGPHATLVSAASKKEVLAGRQGRGNQAFLRLCSDFDCVVSGDGELSIVEALQFQKKHVDADVIGGPMFLSNDGYNELPYPARHLVDLNSYHYTIDGERATSLIAQLGCPFGCGFCGGRQSPMLRKIRTRSVESILKEIEQIHTTYGHKGFMFYDDELNVSKSLIELMDGITDLQMRLGVEFKLRGFMKSELTTEPQLRAMRRAGFRWILVGFESGSPRILDNINKKATQADNTRCVELAHRCDLKVKALMSVGHPGESEETVLQTRDWLLQVKPADFDVTVISTYPGTPYYDDAVLTSPGIWTYTCLRSKDRLHGHEIDYSRVADYYKGTPDGGYQAYVHTDFLSSERIVELRDMVENDVREKLVIPFNQASPSIAFEHSMGQLPPSILRSTAP
jgi:anaerobic magnesium-protoporphyrin IX monomethyl ester cyclase